MRSYTIDLAESQGRPPAASEQPAPAVVPMQEEPQPAPVESAPEETAPEPATAEPTPPAAAPVTSGWAVQIGSFASLENAERLTQELKTKGFTAYVSQATTGRKLYRVRVGPEADRPAAEALAARLRTAGQPGSIVAHP